VRPAAALAVTAFALAAPAALAQGHTYALVSAVGSTLSYVRLRMETGSHLDGYERFERPVPGAALDGAVLRGLERVIAAGEPDARFTYLRLNPAELDGTYAYRRGEVAIGKLATALEKLPERRDWYRIVVVTPRYVNSEREGLGSKLHGIGIYVRPIGSGFGSDALGEFMLRNDPDTVSPDGAPSRSSRFVAPFFYAQVWVLDAATLKVLETNDRYDFQRLYDPESTAVHIEDSIPPEKLAPMLEKFVEQSSARALREAIGEVIVNQKAPVVK
jgi:hypothetical protein